MGDENGERVSDDGARIRLIDVYREVISLGTRLAVLTEQVKDVPDHESRLRKLEKWRYGLPFAGLLAVVSAALSAYGWLRHG